MSLRWRKASRAQGAGVGRRGQLAEEEVWRGCGGEGGEVVSGSCAAGVGLGEASPQSRRGGSGRRLDALSRQGPGPRQLRARILQGTRGLG